MGRVTIKFMNIYLHRNHCHVPKRAWLTVATIYRAQVLLPNGNLMEFMFSNEQAEFNVIHIGSISIIGICMIPIKAFASLNFLHPPTTDSYGYNEDSLSNSFIFL